ncbi:MAG: HAMP domain-containing sensor histidine kinase [Thermoguttaceae bacterium]
MLREWPLRVKFLVVLGLLLLLLGILSGSGLYATYAYRSLVKNLSWRAVELPLAAELSQQVGDLRMELSELRGLRAKRFPHADPDGISLRAWMVRDEFAAKFKDVENTLNDYCGQLDRKIEDGSPIADNEQEWETVRKIEAAMARVREANHDQDWILNNVKVDLLDGELENLQQLVVDLPSYLHKKLERSAVEVRNQYRVLIVGTWVVSISGPLIFALGLQLFYQWVFRPLRVLINGSRIVAGGQFNYRIGLNTDDEMAELAEAMNDMTSRFQAIRDDLDRQVQERTKQVVRNEQLASVGFLAAGVAHEINNPLASIALCAESLESRVVGLLDSNNPDHAIIANYLNMIQSEAFRCKGITEKLLDFSRMGPVRRQNTDLTELIGDVVEMVGHLGKYQRKNIQFQPAEATIASVNPQEIKQVVLNLLTNALDSLEDGGTVWIELRNREGCAEMTVTDNGCGMEPEVLEHIFEPFFTRRRNGQGTGLGLSITYRIVCDHGGEIEAESPGVGRGSTLRVRIPLAQTQKECERQSYAA